VCPPIREEPTVNSGPTDSVSGILHDLIEKQQPQLVFVTGEKGAGKTAWCQTLVTCARSLGLSVGGVLSPPEFTGQVKTGILLENLATGERRQLAARRPQLQEDAPTKKWRFDDEVLRWGDQILQRQEEALQVLLIDEMGPLEFEHGQGLMAGFDVIDRRAYQVGLVVVRPALLAAAHRRWQSDRVLLIREGKAYPLAAANG